MNPIVGFAPDADPVLPGVLVDCQNLLPCALGMRAAPSEVPVGAEPLPEEVRGSLAAVDLAGSRIAIVGTTGGLYRMNGNTWADVAEGQPIALGSDERWSFAQFANSTVASSLSSGMLIANGTDFAPIPKAPKAKVLIVLKGFVMALNTEDTDYGTAPDRWWCSASLNAADWVPNVATLCTTGRLVESGGAITAGERLGDDVVVYKRRSTFLGRFAGSPEVWNFTHIDGEVGCVGQEAVCNAGRVHYFIGDDDFYTFDGVQVKPLGRGVLRDWYTAKRDPKYVHRSIAFWDKINQLIWFFFPSTRSGGVIDCGVVYHPDTGKWGRIDCNVQSLMRYASPPATFDSGIPGVTTYNTGPSIPYDSPYWIESQELIAGFDRNDVLVTFSGVAAPASFTTGDYGDDEMQSWCDRLTLRFRQSPQEATATGYTKDDSGQSAQQASQTMRRDGFFDLRQRGRWHRFKVDIEGDFTLSGLQPRLKQAGYR